MKKVMILVLLCFLSGCGFASGGVRLFNGFGSFWGGTPDTVSVVKGDTLYSISRRYNVPLRDIIEANNLRPPYNLYVGQILRMPNAKYHVVAKGDTLYNISKRYNVDVSSLSRANNIQQPYTLNIGQRLAIPGAVVSTQSYSTASTSSTSSGSSYTKTTTTSTPAPTLYRKTKFAWPMKGTILSKYGTIGKGRTNDGINIKGVLGAPVKAADKGTVAYAGNELKGFGNLILIKHDDGWITAYANNDQLLVKKGQTVMRGEKIATVGSSGGVSCPQLHFEVRSGKKALNPENYLE